MGDSGSGKGANIGLKSPKSPLFTLVSKDGRRVQVSRRDIEQMIIRRKAAQRGSGSLTGLGMAQPIQKSPSKSPKSPSKSPGIKVKAPKTPPRIRENWNAKKLQYIMADPTTGRRVQISRKKIEKERAKGLVSGSPALARKIINAKATRLAAAKLLPPKTPKEPKEPKEPKAPKTPKEPKEPKITQGWSKDRSKYLLKTNNGRTTRINSKKIDATRARNGMLLYSSPKLAREYVDRLARRKAGILSPKQKKERVVKVREGWTTANKIHYMLPTSNGRTTRINSKKIDATRARIGMSNYSSPQLAREYVDRRARHRAGEFSPKVKKERAPKPPVQEGWTKNGTKYVLPTASGRISKIKAEKIDEMRRINNGKMLYSSPFLARQWKDRKSIPPTNTYDAGSDTYLIIDADGKTRRVAGKKVRDAMDAGEGSNALALAKKILVYRTKNPGVDRKRDKFKTKIGDATKTFTLSRLEVLQSKYALPTLGNAAQKYVDMDGKKPPKGTSGYAPNMGSNFNTKYYYWTGRAHAKVAPSEMQKYKNAGMSDEDAARRAMDKREPGWTKDGSRYFVNMTDSSNANLDRKLRGIDKSTMDRIQSRLKSFGLPSNDTDAGLAWVKSKQRKASAKGRPSSYFDYADNKFISDGVPIPGHAFVPAYLKQAVDNKGGEKQSGIIETVQRDVVGDLAKNDIVESVQQDEPARAKLDAALLKIVPREASSKAFGDFLVKLASYGGPLESRPLLAGNVGYPEKEQRSPMDQLKSAFLSEGKIDGCKLLKEAWPRGQGYGLQLHQGIIYTMANLRALDKIKTPGLAAIHSVGAGKTIEGLATLVAFWNKTFVDAKRVQQPWGIFPMSVRSNQSGNDVKTLAADAVKFFRFFKSTYPGSKNPYPFAGSIKAARHAIEERIIGGYRALGYTKSIDRSRHLLGSFGTTAHNFYGDVDSRGRWTAPGFPFIGKGERLLKKVQHAVFIVDEIQLLNGGSKSEASLLTKEYPQIRKLLSQHRDPATTWVLGMTATPGESLEDVAKVMEYISGSKGGFGTEKLMRKSVRGLVSYAFTMADTTKFPAIQVVHECIDLNPSDENAEKGPFAERYASTLLKYHETKNINMLTSEWGAGDGGAVRIASEPGAAYMDYNASQKHKFWLRVRRASEYIMVGAAGEEADQESNNNNSNSNGGSGVSKNTTKGTANGVNSKTLNTLMGQSKQSKMPIVREIQGYYAPSQYRGTTRGAAEPAKKQREFFYIISPKIVQIAASIMDPTNIGVHYVYSPDSKTLRLLAWLLKTRFGFEQYKAGARGDKARFAYVDTMSKPSPWWYGTDGKPHEQFGVSAVDIKGLLDKRTGILRLKGNERGEKVRVVLATRESYKGIDIKGVTHLHLTSTLPDYIDLIQFIGRATRMCGHDGLRMSQRKVTVHIYKLVSGVTERTLQNSRKVLEGGCLAGGDRKLLPDCYVMDQAISRFNAGWGKIEDILMQESVDFPVFKDNYNKAVRELHKQIITKRPCLVLAKPDLGKLIKKVTTPKKPRKVNEVLKLAKQMAKLGLK